MEPLEIARSIADWITDKKGENVLITDVRPITTVTDYFIISDAASDRQINAIVENIRENCKILYDTLPMRVEGTGESGWVLMDYGRVVVHVFSPDRRAYYDLEGLWKNAPVVVRML